MKRVTGIGGIFFKVQDFQQMRSWYSKHLGISTEEGGYGLFWSRDDERPEERKSTTWSLFKADSDYFQPSTAPFMINYRVENLVALLEALRSEGVRVEDKIEEFEFGKFGWIYDPEGNKIELWEPIDKPFEES
ncbi:MAG: VOC family protein [Ignavibacteria bacterium]|nr:VOC family protein [Ignavibacteria bacterium]